LVLWPWLLSLDTHALGKVITYHHPQLLGGAMSGIQDLKQANHMLYHWATPPAFAHSLGTQVSIPGLFQE
jgi:hypothetical protein